MKQTLIKVLSGLTLCAALALAPCVAHATGALNPLNITNNLQGAATTTVITSYPTNTFNSTNGWPQNTGQGVYIGNVSRFNFNVQGFLVNTGATANLTFTLLSSPKGSSPLATSGTNQLSVNQTVLTANDWNTVMPATNSTALIGYPVVIPVPGFTTNWFNWSTNFDASWSKLAGDNWVGVYSISNPLTAGCFLTNSAAYINTKIIPVGLIGN